MKTNKALTSLLRILGVAIAIDKRESENDLPSRDHPCPGEHFSTMYTCMWSCRTRQPTHFIRKWFFTTKIIGYLGSIAITTKATPTHTKNMTKAIWTFASQVMPCFLARAAPLALGFADVICLCLLFFLFLDPLVLCRFEASATFCSQSFRTLR